MRPSSSRRQFLKQSGAALVGAALTPRVLGATAFHRGDATLRVALVGCGGRGTGAAAQALATAGPVQLVAVADAFRDRIDDCLRSLTEAGCGERLAVPEERKFVGFDAFEKAMEDVDVVILATPPGFRPQHFAAAVDRGLHVFMEKPVAVDAPGVRQVLAAAELARKKNLKVGVGLQRHHEAKYLETVRRVQDGAIGELTLLRCYWNSDGVWVQPRQEGMTEMEYQMRNWYYFNWLCGDHIVEQHIHNLDVCNWVAGQTPVRAQGQGGRQVRVGKDYGEIYDHHMVEFTYASGLTMLSQCRHIKGCAGKVAEEGHGTRGTVSFSGGAITAGGEKWRYRTDQPQDPYQVEHDDLFRAIREDLPYDEAENGARATMTAILGRMATYSGQEIEWDQALASTVSLAPARYAFDATPPVLPDADGLYAAAVPGVTQVL